MACLNNTALRDYIQLRCDLAADGWFTPDTYGHEFQPILSIPAIYTFLLVNEYDFRSAIVAYVGMSVKLSQRLSNHPVLDQISTSGYWTMRWFKPVRRTELRQTETHYIKKFDPPWNIMCRPRGVFLQ